MRGVVIICGIILACAIAATVYSSMKSRDQRAAASKPAATRLAR